MPIHKIIIEYAVAGPAGAHLRLKTDPGSHTTGLAIVDAGDSGAEVVLNLKMPILTISGLGRGSRQMCRVDNRGFPRCKLKAAKRISGFQTGDMVCVVIEEGKHPGRACGQCSDPRTRRL